MATTEEEIRAKLSLDTSVLARAKRDIANFSQEGHSGFVHAESGARGFHRLLERITEASPIMGNALKLAISPINGMMAIAAGAFTLANQALEKFNESLDRMSAKNAKALLDIRAVNEALFKRSEAAQEQRLNFEQTQRGHQPPIIEEIKAANPGINDIGLRALLIQRRRQLFGLGVGQMGELDAAEMGPGSFQGSRMPGALEKAKQIREKLAARLEEIKPERSKANAEEAGESASWIERPYWWMNLIPGGGRIQNALNRPREAERESLSREFYKITEELKKQDDLIRKMEKIEKDSTRTVEDKRKAIEAINKDIRDIDTELRKLPAPVAMQTNIPHVSPIDPLTGGYAYRGIQDKGGIAYRPLPGSIGYVAPGMEPKKLNAETVTEMLKAFLTGANTEGVKIIIKDVAVEK